MDCHDQQRWQRSIETWIELIESDRVDLEILNKAFSDVFAGGWTKLSRVGEVLAEVASVSPAHSWAAASQIDACLVSIESWPRDVAKLLEPLDECCETLERTVTPELAERLQGIKSGKAKKLAKSLLDRSGTITTARQAAIDSFLSARLDRAKRFALLEQ